MVPGSHLAYLFQAGIQSKDSIDGHLWGRGIQVEELVRDTHANQGLGTGHPQACAHYGSENPPGIYILGGHPIKKYYWKATMGGASKSRSRSLYSIQIKELASVIHPNQGVGLCNQPKSRRFISHLQASCSTVRGKSLQIHPSQHSLSRWPLVDYLWLFQLFHILYGFNVCLLEPLRQDNYWMQFKDLHVPVVYMFFFGDLLLWPPIFCLHVCSGHEFQLSFKCRA